MNKHNSSLNPKQIHLLKLIYKFRFVTADLIAKYKGISKRAVNEAFLILLNQEYIARYYNSSYKLHGKSAQYYLAPKALKLLRDEHQLNKGVLHARYKDKSVGNLFIEHNLNILRTFLSIRGTYPDTFHIFAKAELAGYDYFPKPLPDLYLKRIAPIDDKPNDYLIDIFEDTWAFIIQKRVDQYIKHFEDDEWIGDNHPTVIIVCPDIRITDKIHKYIEKKLDERYIDESELKLIPCVSNILVEII